jgi:hypothetical protein
MQSPVAAAGGKIEPIIGIIGIIGVATTSSNTSDASGCAASLEARFHQSVRGSFAELKTITPREIPQVPKSESERTRLYTIRSGQQSLPHEPETPQAQISVEAHSSVSLNRLVHGPHRGANFSRKFITVDRTPNVTGQYFLNISENPEIPEAIRMKGPSCVNHVGECGINSSQ